MKKNELKEILDAAGVAYHSTANKDELEALVAELDVDELEAESEDEASGVVEVEEEGDIREEKEKPELDLDGDVKTYYVYNSRGVLKKTLEMTEEVAEEYRNSTGYAVEEKMR